MYETDQGTARRDICIETDAFHTPETLTAFACAAVRESGYSVEENRPFAGAFVPMAYYGRDARVSSIMVQVKRGLYMDERTGERWAGFGAVVESLVSVLAVIAREGLAGD